MKSLLILCMLLTSSLFAQEFTINFDIRGCKVQAEDESSSRDILYCLSIHDTDKATSRPSLRLMMGENETYVADLVLSKKYRKKVLEMDLENSFRTAGLSQDGLAEQRFEGFETKGYMQQRYPFYENLFTNEIRERKVVIEGNEIQDGSLKVTFERLSKKKIILKNINLVWTAVGESETTGDVLYNFN